MVFSENSLVVLWLQIWLANHFPFFYIEFDPEGPGNKNLRKAADSK